MEHVTYEFYCLNGGRQPEDVFHRTIKQAESFVRYITMNIATLETDAEKRAVCSVVDVFANRKEELKSGKNVASESHDGWSVTFNTGGGTAEDAVLRSAKRAAAVHLIGTGLSSRRVPVID